MMRALVHNLPIRDEDFDRIYPSAIQELSEKHWTPIDITKRAVDFLVNKPGTKVLDIGSGVGKFCIVGSQISSGIFIGVEQRKNLVSITEKIIDEYNLQNINVIHSNIVDIDFTKFDSFYFYNSFYENIEKSAIIDTSLNVSYKKYLVYRDYVLSQFAKVPLGTRVVTYSGFDTEIPPSFSLVKTERNFNLKFWIKDKHSTSIPFFH